MHEERHLLLYIPDGPIIAHLYIFQDKMIAGFRGIHQFDPSLFRHTENVFLYILTVLGSAILEGPEGIQSSHIPELSLPWIRAETDIIVNGVMGSNWHTQRFKKQGICHGT